HTARTHADEAKLADIVSEIGDDVEPTAAARSTPAEVPERASWTDEVARRAEILTKEPNVAGLLALRADVAALHAANSAEGRVVESMLRRLDENHREARLRQLEIDRRAIAAGSSRR